MTLLKQKLGFTYFSSSDFLIINHLAHWMELISSIGGSYVVFNANFDVAIPEDVFRCALENKLEPILHFKSELPTARHFNETALLLDIYKKWGVKAIIFGDKPNKKDSWQSIKWQFDTLVDNFLDRFTPLAEHSIRNNQKPILAPLFPGGDFWDTAFLELLLERLKQRQENDIIDHILLSSYGYTFNKPISWGKGGPERWPGIKPYQKLPNQEDQIGFNNFEWLQAISKRVFGEPLQIIMLDAGSPNPVKQIQSNKDDLNAIKGLIKELFERAERNSENFDDSIFPPKEIASITFNLEAIKDLASDSFSSDFVRSLFAETYSKSNKIKKETDEKKIIEHYLLLPSYPSGVSDVVLYKIRPYIKAFQPTIGFSIEEASYANRVSIFPDPYLFSDEDINQLRGNGCFVEFLPETGIDIATLIQKE